MIFGYFFRSRGQTRLRGNIEYWLWTHSARYREFYWKHRS